VCRIPLQANQVTTTKHRELESAPKLLLAAVAVFAIALTWRLMLRVGPEGDWREPVFMILALGSGGAASVVGLHCLLNPSLLGKRARPVDRKASSQASPTAITLADRVVVDRAVSDAVVQRVEIIRAGQSTPDLSRYPESNHFDPRLSAMESVTNLASGLERMTADELGERVAGLYRGRGESVEMQPDPGLRSSDLLVLAGGRRRVVHCMVGPDEVTTSGVRELVGFRDIEHADDATLVTTVAGSEAARNLALTQGIQWIGPAELSQWMAVVAVR